MPDRPNTLQVGSMATQHRLMTPLDRCTTPQDPFMMPQDRLKRLADRLKMSQDRLKRTPDRLKTPQVLLLETFFLTIIPKRCYFQKHGF